MFLFFSRSEFSPIYESINFAANTKLFATNKNKAITTTTTTTDDTNVKNIQPIQPLERQNAFDNSDGGDNVVKRKQSNERDVRDFLDRCIPPPPVTSPPHDTDDSETDDPVQISHQTLEKLNSLYSLYKWRRSASNEPNETIEAKDNVVLRLRELNEHSSSRQFRGSSKAMCSFVSVKNTFAMWFLCYMTTHTYTFNYHSIFQSSFFFISECGR